MTYQVTILAFDDCFTSGVTSLLDLFHVANRRWQQKHRDAEPIFNWRVVSPDGEPVRTTSRLILPVDGSIRSVERPEMFIIPGSDYTRKGAYLAMNEHLSRVCGPTIRRLRHEGSVINASCGGTFLAAECHIIQDEPVTIAWWLASLFRERFPEIRLEEEKLLIDHNNLITAGAAAYLDVGLYIIEKVADRFLMLDCARIMLADANRASQMPYIYLQQQIAHNDALIIEAQTYFRTHMRESFDLQTVAQSLNISRRTLIRRFQKALGVRPTEYLQDLRIETAKRLLETSNMTLDHLVAEIGYQDVSSFRRLFKQRTALTPNQYRQKFSPRQNRQ